MNTMSTTLAVSFALSMSEICCCNTADSIKFAHAYPQACMDVKMLIQSMSRAVVNLSVPHKSKQVEDPLAVM